MLGIPLLPDPSPCSELYYHEHNVHNCPFKETWSCFDSQLHWDSPHTLYAKPWANLDFPLGKWQTDAETVAHIALACTTQARSRASYNHPFNRYQNKTKTNYHKTGSCRAVATTGGKQTTTTKARQRHGSSWPLSPIRGKKTHLPHSARGPACG